MAEFDMWNESWKSGDIRWQEGQVNAMLKKHVKDLTSGQTNLRVFVPKCGKSVDLRWLADNGHTVVGVELAEIAVKSFFEENQIEFTTEAINLAPNGANIFRAKENAPTIFNCDIFCLSSEVLGGKFDAIWDRGALVALDTEELRAKYVEILSSLLAPNGRWMLEMYDYNRADNPSLHPNRLLVEDVTSIFSDRFIVELLEKHEVAYAPTLPYKHVLQLFLLKWKL